MSVSTYFVHCIHSPLCLSLWTLVANLRQFKFNNNKNRIQTLLPWRFIQNFKLCNLVSLIYFKYVFLLVFLHFFPLIAFKRVQCNIMYFVLLSIIIFLKCRFQRFSALQLNVTCTSQNSWENSRRNSSAINYFHFKDLRALPSTEGRESAVTSLYHSLIDMCLYSHYHYVWKCMSNVRWIYILTHP